LGGEKKGTKGDIGGDSELWKKFLSEKYWPLTRRGGIQTPDRGGWTTKATKTALRPSPDKAERDRLPMGKGDLKGRWKGTRKGKMTIGVLPLAGATRSHAA